MDQILLQLKNHVHDKKHFSARGLARLSKQLDVAPDLLTSGLSILLVLYLELGRWNYLVANGLLILYPIVATYVFPEERPTRDLLLVYWSCFGLLTVFDRLLESAPLYYVVKIVGLALFFLEPCLWAEKINKLIEVKLVEYNILKPSELSKTCSLISRSPTPSKPVDHYPPERKEAEIPKEHPIPEDDPQSGMKNLGMTIELSKSEGEQLNTSTKSEYVQTPADKEKATISSDGLGKQPTSRENPMLTDSSYVLGSENSSIDKKDVDPMSNIHDMLFWPQDQLIFNGPFDFENLTYHQTIKNNSKHRIAFAIKGNCIPHVIAYPPHGILVPGEKKVIAVTVRKFDWNEVDYNKQRICYEYVLLQDSDKIEEFNHKLLLNSDMSRRKNIKIIYNP